MKKDLRGKILYLSFDDGPNEPYTTKILEILNSFGVKATFFVCGENIEKYPESLKNIVNHGQTLGIHSYSHSLRKTLLGSLYPEIIKTKTLIKNIVGVETNLYRSPWGITRPQLRKILLNNSFIIFHWDVMAFDWWPVTPDFIARRIIKKVFPGAIILLHDGNQTRPGNRENTVLALPIIIKELVAQGYTFSVLTP